MFNAKFISATSGISKKSGNEWYKVELIADTVTGGNKVLSEFCTQNAFNSASSLKPMQQCRVMCSVTDNGHIAINSLKGE